MANNKTIEPTIADSGEVDKALARGSPNHSSPFLKTIIGHFSNGLSFF